ncbi:hypothetical protein SAMN05428975_4600 [Mucilaginibacter sp. OK268]|uniref:hypothetical protein n=1 Tax=Mucilaginibacter sp. OK268 TaxID=1881048 RepID=UPI000889DDC5|nr:hypothetical protein [Mucilaginibacter sp. OK268]SDP98060.1 hypothetical protein SAMN05428975_4600 [Mucilaginibacter sp. OK268]
MLPFKTLLLLGLVFVTHACFSQKINDIPKDAIKGDFNGDGKPEYVWVVRPKIADSGVDCVGGCAIKIVSSNPEITALVIPNAIGGTITNLGDLNDNGTDEIGILPEWFTSCWSPYYVYTLAHRHWQEVVPSFSTHCNQWEADVKPIEKAPGKKGYVVIRYSAFEKEDIVTKTKILPIK